MVTLRRSAAPPEEALGTGGTITASATRATSCGNIEQEVQQSTRQPRNQRDARPQGQASPDASLHDAPTSDLRQKINDGRDTRRIIEARRRDHPDRYHDDDDNDRFPAFTFNITKKFYPKNF
jgi:hypothetical protein